jgi:hypothetical protein
MSEPSTSIFAQAQSLYAQLSAANHQGKLPPIQLAHWPILDTPLAACLLTLGIPYREPAPFTDEVDAASGARRKCFWVGDTSICAQYKTEHVVSFWEHRTRFEAEFPLHPLVAMRAALEARRWWIEVTKGTRTLAAETRAQNTFSTPSLREAAILKTSGFAPLAFTGRAFIVGKPGAAAAQEILDMSYRVEGASPAQWMCGALKNHDELLKIARGSPPIIRERDGETSLLLRADATDATHDKFRRHF